MPCPKRLRDEQDPDYPDEPAIEGKRQRIAIQAARADACERVRRVVQQHFGDELRRREESLMECQSRLHEATQALHLLRYLAVSAYYSTKTTQQQTRLHPAVKKLVGKQGAERGALHLNVPDVNHLRLKNISLPSTSRGSLASTSSQPAKTSIRDGQAPIKQPRYVAPKEKESTSLVSPSRASARKVKKRLLVGNISKWLGEELREGAATHKWMMYVRGPPDNPDISNLVERVRFYLHSSYQPHDVIEVKSHPFHLSRRGWGEFPVRLQIHFCNSENRPLDVIHQLRLDRTYTGLQTLGAETLVDAWLFEGPQAKEPTATVTSSSIEPPIKQEASDVSASFSAISSVNYEAAESLNRTVTSTAQTTPQKATRSLLKQFNTSTSPSASSVVKECFKNVAKKEHSMNDNDKQISQNQINVLNTPPINTTLKTENIIKVMSPNQGSLARFLCGQINTSSIKVETINSSSITVSRVQPSTSGPSIEVLNQGIQVRLDNARMLQHHDYAKPAVEADSSIQNSKNIQVVSGTSLLKSNMKTCSDLSLLTGKKIIQLKPVTSSNQLKPIPVSPKQTNQIISLNQNKSIQVLNSASILKNLPGNGVNKLVNGTKLLLSKGVENNQRVILVKMDKNGKFQQIPQQSTHNLPPLPPLVMIKKPLGSSQIATSQIKQLNPALIKSLQIGSNTMQSIKIEPGLWSDSQTGNVKQNILNSMTQGTKTYTHSLLINKQGIVSNQCTGNISINGKQIFTVATSSGMNVLVKGQDSETEKFERLVLSYEQQLKQLECRSVDDVDLALSLLLRHLPLIGIKDDAYCQVHPYIVPCAEIFFSWHIGKQRAFEAMRARLVGRLLIAQGFPARKLWDIVRWARHHGYSPLPCEPTDVNPQVSIKQEVTDCETQEYLAEGAMNKQPKSSYTYSEPNAVLGWLESHVVDRSKFEDEIVDVENVTVKNTKPSGHIESHTEEDLSHIGEQCMAVRNVASELGIDLNDQSATMMMEVGKLFMEDLIRRALAEACSKAKSTPSSIELNDVRTALLNRPEFDIFSNHGLGMEPDLSFSQAYKS